jgi:hypothetical protein
MDSTSKNFGNPIAFGGIPELLGAVVNVFIVISTPIVVFYLIYAGFMYVTARGDPEQIKQASTALMYGVIGGVVIIGSIAILQIITGTVEKF